MKIGDGEWIYLRSHPTDTRHRQHREGKKRGNADGSSRRPDQRGDDGYIAGSLEELSDRHIAVLVRETASYTAGKTGEPDIDHEVCLDRLSRMAEGRPGDRTDCQATDECKR